VRKSGVEASRPLIKDLENEFRVFIVKLSAERRKRAEEEGGVFGVAFLVVVKKSLPIIIKAARLKTPRLLSTRR
jgi:hypothetical protein